MASRIRNPLELSSNQLAKRERIIEAAVSVLLDQGVSSCTVRTIAGVAKTSKGIVHYYFSDIDEIIDAAMLKAVTLWREFFSVSQPGDGQVDLSRSRKDFWEFIDKSMEPFSKGDKTMMPLLLEYWALGVRRQRISQLQQVQNVLVDLVAELLDRCQIEDPPGCALSVTSYLIGVTMVEAAAPVSKSEVIATVANITGIEIEPGDR